MNLPTPKQTFQEGPHAKKWLDITGSEMWRDAMHTGLAQMTLSTAGGDPGFATKIQGAKDFMVILTNLAEPSPPKAAPPKKLKH